MPNRLEDALPNLIEDLQLERRRENAFRGHSPESANGRIFGGLVFAQAMRAAQATVAGRAPHSAHAYFLHPGNPDLPIDYEVDLIRDGRSFTTRRVVALQDEKPIFNLSLSCQVAEEGARHQRDQVIPEQPEGESHEEGIRRGLAAMGIEVSREDFGFGAFELRVEGGLDMAAAPVREPSLACWMRARGDVPSDEFGLHAALLAFVSDLTIMIPAFHPLEFGAMSPGVQSASIDHALWFHAPFRVDDWLYAVQESPVMSGNRALGRALFYSREGRLIASAVQEGLVRRRETSAS